ncbi:DUF2523 family protein [Chitinimonas taiwanensis]|uniref:DUF2523 domain-containing protein n=1 Tax=Chitinimonas taiwanensis DSM 18899 TaxID=1121279 RepID=A0A1K2HQI8_9NEIS|nr:DUF2523 family protein [Chitinimonas taiwanensis]SFZ78817.1 Protein of unknown function [Chitinimonas taiwanensis DSM 18899]
MLLAPLGAFVATSLTAAVGSMVGRALIALGVGVISYQGLDVMLTKGEAYVTTQLQLVPPDVMNILTFLGVTAMIKMHLATVAGIAGVKVARKSFGVLSK